jgi:hypothetical protein
MGWRFSDTKDTTAPVSHYGSAGYDVPLRATWNDSIGFLG